jgi:2-dehydro-3-deoxygluconokinase
MIVLVAGDGEPLETATTVALHCAGAESNVAHYLAQLGHRVAWASRLGDDPFGRRILAELASADIDVSGVELAAEERTGVYFKDPSGEPSVHYYRTESAASNMTLDAILPAVLRADRLHVSGITAALGGTSASMLPELMRRASDAGLHVSFDVNHRPALWPESQAAPALAALARLADTVFVGRDEAEVLWGTTTAADAHAFLPDVQTLVVKDGDVGATAFVRGQPSVFVPAVAVDVLDSVGAGDAFAGGYLSGLIAGGDVTNRLRLGHLIAGHALVTRGDYAPIASVTTVLGMLSASESEWAALHFGHVRA